MDYTSHDNLSDMDIQIDSEARRSLTESSKWTKFISITIFILIGIFLLIFLGLTAAYPGDFFDSFDRLMGVYFGLSATVIIAIVLASVAVYLYTFYLILHYSKKIKTALATENTADLNAGLNSLKIYFIINSVISALILLLTLYNLKAIF